MCDQVVIHKRLSSKCAAAYDTEVKNAILRWHQNVHVLHSTALIQVHITDINLFFSAQNVEDRKFILCIAEPLSGCKLEAFYTPVYKRGTES